ncbi:MAG: aldo/keto reductase [Dehalococcoidia bacterium]|nr:aldo/keto reductase [Dehalococcoidia bacterium]
METRLLDRTNTEIPAIGMGTWLLVDSIPDAREDRLAIESLQAGIDLGMTLIDTAESYSDGRAEEIVGKAIRGIRDRVFLATKVSPENFSFAGIHQAARGSLKRLGTDCIDLYQLHRPSLDHPLEETMKAMEHLVDEGLVRFIGVSNFPVDLLMTAQKSLTRSRIVANQVRYSVVQRGIEADLLPYAAEHGVTIIAYSPFEHGFIFDHRGRETRNLRRLAEQHGRTFAQVCLNWLIEKPHVVTIPKALQVKHVRENAGAAGWRMRPEDYRSLDRIPA